MAPKISALIITRNEEENIRYCLETLKWCDEIVLVDMESTDNTVSIAKEYTNKVFSHTKVLEFDIARKYALENSSSDWVLQIDADELIPYEAAEKLRLIAANDEADAIFVPFKNYILGQWNRCPSWWPNYHCRFFKKSAMQFTGKIHNYQILRSSARKFFLPPNEKFSMHHFSYRDSTQFLEKLNRYTTIEASHFLEDNIQFSIFKMFWSGISEFYRRFFVQRGFRDGMCGLFVSMMMAIYRIITHVKLWEMRTKSGVDIIEYFNSLKKKVIRSHEVK